MKNTTVVLMFRFTLYGGKADGDKHVQKLKRTEPFARLIFLIHSLHHSNSWYRLGLKYSRAGRLFQFSLRSSHSELQCWIDSVYQFL